MVDHTVKAYDKELDTLERRIAEMGGIALPGEVFKTPGRSPVPRSNIGLSSNVVDGRIAQAATFWMPSS